MPWYDMDDEVRKLILFMLMRSQKELILNVAGLSNIDYNTFKTVRVTYSRRKCKELSIE